MLQKKLQAEHKFSARRPSLALLSCLRVGSGTFWAARREIYRDILAVLFFRRTANLRLL